MFLSKLWKLGTPSETGKQMPPWTIVRCEVTMVRCEVSLSGDTWKFQPSLIDHV